ncbi:MAG TPA: hypothetical protein PLZ79_07780 [Burkholderiales bacterium]|nr:hypothetical protein [Burkholderiales bacterium]
MLEYLRPWKLLTLALGTGLLIIGALYYEAPDWDVPISLIMALLSYLTASWSMRIMLERRWKQWPAMLFWTWFTVDGAYWVYWRLVDPVALDMMREANWPASLSLYWICGVIWLPRGSLARLFAATRQALCRPGVATARRTALRLSRSPNHAQPGPNLGTGIQRLGAFDRK